MGTTALTCAWRLDEAGDARELDWPDLARDRLEKLLAEGRGAYYWVQMNRSARETQRWLREESGLPRPVCDAMLAEETRPRCTLFEDGCLLNLRAVNLNPGAEPEDMVSVRVWIDARRIITLNLRRVRALEDVRAMIEDQSRPKTPPGLLAALIARIVDRIDPEIAELSAEVDMLEDQALSGSLAELPAPLGELRRRAVALRRYIAPQKEAVLALASIEADWLSPAHRWNLRESADRITRLVEDLDAAREAAAFINDEITARVSERMNRNMYLLSLIAGIFLPLGLLTGLLGINVGGIPGGGSPWGFAAVCGLLLLVGAFEIWLFRRLKWL